MFPAVIYPHKSYLHSLPSAGCVQSKYQLNIDGTVAAYRLPYLLAGDSLVLKQHSEYYEHFYKRLLPWKHYIPINRDLSNLLDQIQWARDNDAQVARS